MQSSEEKKEVLYSEARRYADEEKGIRAYQEGQETILSHEEIGLSIYRIKFGRRLLSHVVVVGSDEPPQPLKDTLKRILKAGKKVALPLEIINYLEKLRIEVTSDGSDHVKHYEPGQEMRVQLPKYN
jgi:hypothetical protein